MVESFSGKLTRNEPLARYTSFRIGGNADLFFVPEDIEDLKRGLSYALEKSIPWFILGNGSNILVSDAGIEGMVIHLENKVFRSISFEGKSVTVGAGMKTGTFLQETVKRGFGGTEFLSAVPATMGGAFYMNAGTYLGEMSGVVEEVTYLDDSLNARSLPREGLHYRYRKSVFQEKNWVILSGRIALVPMEKKEAQFKVQEILSRRRKTQPLGVPSAGSAFTNPPGGSAWQCIDSAGLRDFSVGDAAISEVHANFVVNRGNAKAADVYTLMRTIQERVLEKSGVLLEPEIRLVGRWETDFLR